MALKDYERQKAYMREYLRKRYAARRAEAIELLGGKCVRCESGEDLQIDHKDRNSKAMNPDHMTVLSREKFLAELDKCQLLCRKCHQKKSIEEVGHNSRDMHGTLVAYQRGKCRCEACRAANAAVREGYRKSIRGVTQLARVLDS